MWDVRACRGCLAIGVKLEKVTDAQKQIFSAVTGLKIIDCDGYPTYFCVECWTMLKKVQAFRRRCKRAYYIMKEIMIVRKEVTYSDILLVNRKKTNLKSPLGYWDRDRTTCYSVKHIDPTDITLELSLTQQQQGQDVTNDRYLTKLLKYEPVQNTMSVQHVIDIKPDKEEEERQMEIESIIKNIHEENADNDYIELADAANNNTDSNSINVESNVENAEDMGDIDMEDVFKGLNLDEGYDDDDDWLPENHLGQDQPVVKRKRRSKIEIETMKEIKKNNRSVIFRGTSAKNIAKALINTDIRILSLAEQKDVRLKLLNSESYKMAKFKCAVCIMSFTSKDILITHLQVHNSQLKDKPHTCQVCVDRYFTADELTGHVYREHMYEYTCNLCKAIGPNLQSIGDHFQNSHKSHLQFYQIDVHFDVTKLTSDELHETAKPESGVKYKYRCQTCNHGFDSHAAYRTHITQHQDIPTLIEKFDMVKCQVCELNMEKKSLKMHMEYNHNYKYKCKKCDRVLYTRKRAVDHLQEHDVSEYENETFKWKCPDCDKVFITPFLMHSHMLKHFVVAENKYSYCNLCGKSFSTKSYIYEHQLLDHGYISIPGSITGDPENNCEKCNIQFSNRRSYIMHLMYSMHEEVNSIENICIICKEIFDSKEDYLNHTDNCKLKGRYPRKCNYCDYIIKVPQDLQKHFHREHPGLEFRQVDSVICEQCGKSVTKTRLKHHQKLHIMEEAKFLQCNFCSMSWDTPTQYTNHVINEHTPNPFYCTICNYSYKFKNSCREHLLSTHTTIKPFGCDDCEKRFGTIDRLTVHYKNVHKINFRLEKPELYKSYSTGRTDRHTIAVYPLMKINASLVKIEILEQTRVELYDYMNKNGTPVDYKDYLSTEPLETKPFKQPFRKGVKRNHDSVKKETVKILTNETVKSLDFINNPNSSKVHTNSAYTVEVKSAVREILTGETAIFNDDINGESENENDDCFDNNDNLSDDYENEVTVRTVSSSQTTESSARVRNVYDDKQKHVNSGRLMNEYNRLLQENKSPEKTVKHTLNRTGNMAKVRKCDDNIQDPVEIHQSINKYNIKIEENRVFTPDSIFETFDHENIKTKVSGNKKVSKVQKVEVKAQNVHESINRQENKTNIPSNLPKPKNIDENTQKSINKQSRTLQENKSTIPSSPTVLKHKTVCKEVGNITASKNVQFEDEIRNLNKINIHEKCQEKDYLKEDNTIVFEENKEDFVVYEDAAVLDDSAVLEDGAVLEDAAGHEEVVIDENFQVIEMNNEQYVLIDSVLYKVEVDKDTDK